MIALLKPFIAFSTLQKNKPKYFWICITLFLILFLYIFFYWVNSPIIQPGSVFASQTLAEVDPFNEASDNCIISKLLKFNEQKEKFNVFINQGPTQEDQFKFLPFIGNGYFGATMKGSNAKFYVKHLLQIPIVFNPSISINYQSIRHKESVVLNILDGLIHEYKCFSLGISSVSVETMSYIHRKRNILVQEIRFSNMEDSTLTFDINSQILSAKIFNNSKIKIDSQRFNSMEFTSGTYCEKSYNICIAIAANSLPKDIIVKSLTPVFLYRFINIKYSNYMSSATSLANENIKDLQNNLKLDLRSLKKEHIAAWNSLWGSGFGISHSKATGSINADKINSTIYYLLSHVTLSFMNQSEVGQLIRPIDFPDRCYSGHPTLQNSNMWKAPVDAKEISILTTTWFKTLDKQGCSNLAMAGAEGVLQAIILSIGGLKFSRDHLEFVIHPQDLHRDFFFRRINYGSDTHLNISVVVNEENKAHLFVALDRNNMPYYACDAGCLDDPVALSKSVVVLPVKLTNPLTPILYITSDLQHMKDLRHVIHIQHIVEAPAHGHEVMVLHKHGHHWSGLPILFWASFISLIVIFHLFLLRLIYNETCGITNTVTTYSNTQRERYGRMARFV